jgi:hypothetical protein
MSDAPLLCFGGPYSNRHALDALLAEAARRGIPPGRMICTGDVVAYCAGAAATLDVMIASGIPTIMGNCEENLAAGRGGLRLRLRARHHLRPAVARLVRPCACPGCPRTTAPGWQRCPGGSTSPSADAAWPVVHGGARSISRFLFPSAPDAVLAEEIAATGAEGVIAGHCGLPFTRLIGQALWHNAGAIGMPADDGTAARLVLRAGTRGRRAAGQPPRAALRPRGRRAGHARSRAF